MILVAIMLALFSSPARAVGFTASVNGNINNGATFGNASPGVQGTDYPANGDWVTVNPGTSVNVPAGFTISLSSVGIHGGGSGSVARSTFSITGGTVTLTGNMVLGFSGSGRVMLQISSGSVFNLNGNNVVMGAGGTSGDYLYFSGTGTYINGGNFGAFTQGAQGGFDNLDINWTNVRFSSMGSFGLGYGTTGADTKISSITWVGSARLQLPQMQATPCQYRFLEYSDFRDTNDTIVLRIRGTNTQQPSVRNEIFNNTFSSHVVVAVGLNIEVDATSVTFRNNVFKNMTIQAATSNGLDQYIDSNVFFSTQAVGSVAQIVWQGSTTVSNNYFYTEGDNPHNWQQATTAIGSTVTRRNNIIEVNTQGTITDDGDTDIFPTSQISSGTSDHNIQIGKRSLSCLMSMQSAAANSSFVPFNNNTIYYNAATRTTCNAFRVGETYGGRAGMVPSIQNNIVMADAASAAGNIVTDLNIAAATDKISTANYNASFNVNGTKYQTTKSVGSYGANDITVNPNFADPTRNLASWDTFVGGPGTTIDAIQGFLQLNGYGGAYNSSYNLNSLLSYVRAGFTPMAQVLKGAGFDGTDIGAVSVAPPTAFFGG